MDETPIFIKEFTYSIAGAKENLTSKENKEEYICKESCQKDKEITYYN